MKPKRVPNRRDYTELGGFLKKARSRIYAPRALKHSVTQIAKQLDITTGFVYQVEQGIRKPKDGDFGRWASVYGVRYVDMWRCLDRIPMNLVALLKTTEQPTQAEQFSQLTEVEKYELTPFLDFVKWKIYQQGLESKLPSEDKK